MAVRRRYALVLGALALAGPTAAAATGATTWRGHTTQGYAVRATLSPSRSLVTHLRTRYELTCSDDSTVLRPLVLSRPAGDTIVVGDNGRFSTSGTVAGGLTDKGSGSLTYKVYGRVRTSRITGFLRVDYALDSGVQCTTGLVGFVLG